MKMTESTLRNWQRIGICWILWRQEKRKQVDSKMYIFSIWEPDIAVQRKTFNEMMFSRTSVIFALRGSGLGSKWMYWQWKTFQISSLDANLGACALWNLSRVCWNGRQDSKRPQLDCMLCNKSHRSLFEGMKWISCKFQVHCSAYLLCIQLFSSFACSLGLGGPLVGNNWVAVVWHASFAEARSSILGRLLQTECPQSGARYCSSCTLGRVHQPISIWMKWDSSTLSIWLYCSLVINFPTTAENIQIRAGNNFIYKYGILGYVNIKSALFESDFGHFHVVWNHMQNCFVFCFLRDIWTLNLLFIGHIPSIMWAVTWKNTRFGGMGVNQIQATRPLLGTQR